MTKANFIRAIEVWVPTSDRTRLTLKTGYYGELDYFERISRGMQFAHDEGLPGKCWATGRPTVLKDLANSYFKRGDAAMNVGLTCAVAFPTFAGPDLKAVTVLFCGGNAHSVGALELWHAPAGEPQMELGDGYFGNAEKFEFASRHTQFSPRVGLPGIVWDSGLPLIMDDLGRSAQFLRRDSAEKVGINRAFGFPCPVREPGNSWVITFLSARNSPIARRVELWLPDGESGTFRFEHGYCESGEDLAALHARHTAPLDVGPLGEARITGIPVIAPVIAPASDPPSDPATDPAGSATGAPDARMVVLPIFAKGSFAANLAFHL